MIADLNATFPGAGARSLRQWSGKECHIGAVVSGEAEIESGYPIGPYIYDAENKAYDGHIHKGFEVWCEARGWYVEVYEPGTLWVIPLPSQQELDEWRAFHEKLDLERAMQPADSGLPF